MGVDWGEPSDWREGGREKGRKGRKEGRGKILQRDRSVENHPQPQSSPHKSWH